MSHIPAKAMPHARAHHDDAAPPPPRREAATSLPLGLAILGGLAAAGAIAAAAWFSTRPEPAKPAPRKGKRRKHD